VSLLCVSEFSSGVPAQVRPEEAFVCREGEMEIGQRLHPKPQGSSRARQQMAAMKTVLGQEMEMIARDAESA
jgi:hypothetical protein